MFASLSDEKQKSKKTERIKTDLKKSPDDSLSGFIFFILGSTHYFSQ